MLYSNRNDPDLQYYNAYKQETMVFEFEEGREPILYGDVTFNFKHLGMMYDTSFCRASFNTAFIGQHNTLVLDKYTVSPDSAKKDSRFSNDFMLQFVFEDFCKLCNKPSEMNVDDLCEDCKKILDREINKWKSI